MSDMNAARMAGMLLEYAIVFKSGTDILTGDPKVVRKAAHSMATTYKSAGVTTDEVIEEVYSQLKAKGYVQ